MWQRLLRFVRSFYSLRHLKGYSQRVGIPLRHFHHVVKALRIATAPVEYIRRRLVTRRLARRATPGISVPADDGFVFFEIGDVAQGRAALDSARRIAEARKPDCLASVGSKSHLINLLEPQDFVHYPQLSALALSDTLVEAAARYLGTVPVWMGMELLYTPPNGTIVSSQLFHCDQADFRQVKFFINVNDVDETSGPLTFVPAKESRLAFEKLGRPEGRVEDDILFACLGSRDAVSLTGPAGCGVAVDTSQCFHYGSRENRKERIVLMIQYLTYHKPTNPCPFLPVELMHGVQLRGLQALAFPSKRRYFTGVSQPRNARRAATEAETGK